MKKDVSLPQIPTNLSPELTDFCKSTLKLIKDLRLEASEDFDDITQDRTALRYTKNDAQTIPTDTKTKIEYDDKDYDLLTEYDTTNHRFTVTTTGKYYIYAQLFTASVAWTAGKYIYLAIFKNGSPIKLKYHEIKVSITAYMEIDCEDTLSLNKDDYIEIYFYHNRGSNTDTYPAYLYNILTIHRIDL